MRMVGFFKHQQLIVHQFLVHFRLSHLFLLNHFYRHYMTRSLVLGQHDLTELSLAQFFTELVQFLNIYDLLKALDLLKVKHLFSRLLSLFNRHPTHLFMNRELLKLCGNF